MFLPPANEVWGKVIFLQASVILSMVGGIPACITGHMTRGACIQGGLHPGGLHQGKSASRKGSASWGSASREVCIQEGVCIQGGLHRGGSASRGWADPLPEIYGILRDTVNKRATRILLECILVCLFVYFICSDLLLVYFLQHVVFGICRLIDILVPDVPESLEIKIKRERYLAKQALADTETIMKVRAQSVQPGLTLRSVHTER